jgi:hypothetical protein
MAPSSSKGSHSSRFVFLKKNFEAGSRPVHDKKVSAEVIFNSILLPLQSYF